MKALSGKELIRIVERTGWVLLRVQGSHHIYENQVVSFASPSLYTATIP